MQSPAADLSARLGRQAEAVCRRYLSRGRREGGYWTVGDVMNTPGRSLYVRLSGPENGPGAAGHWTDAATGEHGDLLDLIGLTCGLTRLRDVLDEARAFLALPVPPLPPPGTTTMAARPRARSSTPEGARRLFDAGRAIGGTLAGRYLASRGLDASGEPCLRFHPRVFHRADPDAPRQTFPALLAAITDDCDRVAGVHRTWLDPTTATKARLAKPRRALGHLLGNGVRFGAAGPVLAAGEGLETMLSLRAVLPSLPAVAALSANHLAALTLPSGLERLYVARERDPAGERAAERLAERARTAGFAVWMIDAERGDLNDDLMAFGRAGLLERVVGQLALEERQRFAPTLAAVEPWRCEPASASPGGAGSAGTPRSSDREGSAPTAF